MAEKIFIFTAGNEAAQAHLKDSIQKPATLEKALATFDSEHHARLKQLHEQHGLYAWGAVPGKQNTPRWNTMEPGDWTLCVYKRGYHYVARVTAKFDNEKFARKVWGSDPAGKTWQLMYFLDKPRAIDAPLDDTADLLGSGFMGFTRISNDKLQRITNEFGDIE